MSETTHTNQVETHKEVTLDRCARIAAAIDLCPEDAVQILAASGLDPESWEAILHGHEVPIALQLSRGQTDMLERFDDAYICRIEEERGPVSAEQYAKLVVAAERASLDQVLLDLEIPKEAMPRIDRIMIRRSTGDAEHDDRLQDAIEAERHS